MKRSACAVLILAALSLTACEPFQRTGSLVEITLPAPAQSRAASLLPAALDSCELLVSQQGSPKAGLKVPVDFDAPIRLSVRVLPGVYELRVLASSGGVVTGLAFAGGVEVLPGKTTTVELPLSVLSFSEPSLESGAGPGDPLARSVERGLYGMPEAFLPAILSGAVRLRARIDRDPASVTDSALDFPATTSSHSEGLSFIGAIPAGTALGNETARYWFTAELPHSDAVISDCLLPQANSITYNGATLSGLVEGKLTNDTEYLPKTNIPMHVVGSSSYSSSSDDLGIFIFGSVIAGTYAASLTIDYGYLSTISASIDGAAFTESNFSFSEDPITFFPMATYSNLSLSPGGIHTLNFRFTGY